MEVISMPLNKSNKNKKNKNNNKNNILKSSTLQIAQQ